MRRLVLVTAIVTVFLIPTTAAAVTRQVRSGNFYFEDVATGSRTQIVANRGDQIVVTVIEPPAILIGSHTVDVDELNIHSGDLAVGQTFTTPPLTKTGNFTLYCDNHRNQGHLTQLVVKAPPAQSTAQPEEPSASSPSGGAGSSVVGGQEAVPLTGQPIPLPALTVPTSPPTTAAPAGIAQASPQQLRAAGVDPDSLEGLIGRNVGGNQPWTRALWFLLIGGVAAVGAAVIAVVRGRSLAAAAAARAAKRSGTAASSSGPRRSSGRSRKSSPRKASASGRKSAGRRL